MTSSFFSDSFGRENFDPLTDMNGDGEVSFDDFFYLVMLLAEQGKNSYPQDPTDKINDRYRRNNTQSCLALTPFWLGKEPTKGSSLVSNSIPTYFVLNDMSANTGPPF